MRSRPSTDHVDLARHAGRPLELLEVLHGGEVLRDEPLEVGHHLGARVQAPAGHRDHEADGEHAARPPQGAAHGRVAGAPAGPANGRRSARGGGFA